MNIVFNIYQLFISLGAIHGFCLCIILFLKKNRNISNHLLAFLVLSFSLASLKMILQEQIPFFNSFLPLLYQFAWGPLVLLYIKSTLLKNFRLTRGHFWHFVPSLLFDVGQVILIFSLGSKYMAPISKITFLIDVLAFVWFLTYLINSIIFLYTYKKTLKSTISSNLGRSLSWANIVIFFSLFLCLAWVTYIFLVFRHNSITTLKDLPPYYIPYMLLNIGVFGLSVAGYYMPQTGLISIAEPVKEKRELLTTKEVTDKKQILEKLFEENCYHHDEKLTLQKLAHQINFSIRDLSYVINEGFKTNFTDFINELRVQDFIKRIKEPGSEQFNIEGLAYEVGFNSKASFYRAFKKSTGKTPSDFLKVATVEPKNSSKTRFETS